MMIKQRFVSEGLLNAGLEEYVKQTLKRANVISVNVQKTALVSRVVIEAERPGLVIGKSGASIKKLQTDLVEKFGIENPQVDVKQLEESPDLSAKLVAKNLAEQISRRPGNTWRRLVGLYVKRIMSAGAQGAEISVKGVLIGKGRPSSKSTESAGHMKKSGHYVNLVRIGKATALKKVGAIGVQVRIVPPDAVFPDKLNIKNFLTEKLTALEKTEDAEPVSEGTEISVSEKALDDVKPKEKPAVKKVVDEKKPAKKKRAVKKTVKVKAEKKTKAVKKKPVKKPAAGKEGKKKAPAKKSVEKRVKSEGKKE